MIESNTHDIFAKISSIKSAGVIERYGFNDFLEIAREVRSNVSDDVWLEVGWDILEGMGLEELYGCDYDILTALEHIPSQSDLVDIQSFLRYSLVETLLEQFDAGGTTVLLDIGKMVGTPADVLIPRIIELRKDEMENTIVPVIGKEIIIYDVFMNEIHTITEPNDAVVLDSLWFTAYGCQVLTSLGLGLRADIDALEKIRNVMEKMEVTLKVGKGKYSVGKNHSNMSEAMKTFILKRAENSTHISKYRKSKQ
ncbi:hypothetical protein EU527_01670 [Candidatus Thorarchaeota archaeon]|nr:MAG: hypothetical protein EU527_01670 [Candidatus Thorarchaeota archaeon]